MELANGKLPPELLSQVASYLDDGDLFILAGYALVCRSWLLVFERLLYRDINVYSDSHESIRDLKAMTLQQFKTRTSGPNFYRRSFVKELHYNIITPCPIKEHWHRPGVGNDYERNLYYEQNLERAEENNVAFREGFEALWGVLSVWDDAHRIAVVLSAACLDEMEKEELGEESWRKSPGDCYFQPCRVQFPKDDIKLPEVGCIRKLRDDDSTNSIWSGAMLQIAEKCTTLEELDVDLYEFTLFSQAQQPS